MSASSYINVGADTVRRMTERAHESAKQTGDRDPQRAPKRTRLNAIASGTLFDGAVDCYILEDGRRVISQRGVLRALRGSRKNHEKSSGPGNADLGRYLARLPKHFAHLTVVPSIEFEMPERGGAGGFEATFLIDVCNAYVDAFFAGDLHPSQHHIARAARAVLSATAKVGIEALIDEATGQQAVRPADYLARRLDAFLRREPATWERAFPPSVIVALCRLYREPYQQGRIPRFLASVFHTIYHVLWGRTWSRN